MSSIVGKIRTYQRLGLRNAITVLRYRLKLRNGHFLRTMPIAPPLPEGRYYEQPEYQANSNIQPITDLLAFGHIKIRIEQPPNWHQSIFNQQSVENNQLHWSQMDDFSLNIGDIKGVWELSRMDWLLHFAVNYRATGDSKYIEKINQWLQDWVAQNPCNQGVNWKCGQEASIRVLHFVVTAFLLEQFEKASPLLVRLLNQHLERIAPTLSYAKAQDNNHGTSEAAALFVGGLFLGANTDSADEKIKYQRWCNAGRKLLENRVNKLIDVDGNFSQNSVYYHRLMLDTLSLAEFFRAFNNQPLFSTKFYTKAKQATSWLTGVVNANTGYPPNFGLNDGANLLPITASDYRDFRPSICLAHVMFYKSASYPELSSIQQICALFKTTDRLSENALSEIAQHEYGTGLLKFSAHQFNAYLRSHDGKFRPSACDALHLDLSHGNNAIFIGSGSYSYNSQGELQDYFNSVEAHNTVQFDGMQQMPKLSRFLYSNWIICSFQEHTSHLVSSYANAHGHKHIRKIKCLSEDTIEIADDVSGFNAKAQLRWHLSDSQWTLTNNKIVNEHYEIELKTDHNNPNISLVEGWHSHYYGKKSPTTVVLVEVEEPCTITTTIRRRTCE